MQLKEEQIILITKHFKGATSVEEEKLLNQWLQENPEHQKAYQELRFIWSHKQPYHTDTPDVDRAWDKVKSRTIAQSANSKRNIRSLTSFNNLLRIAASIIVILTAGYFFLQRWNKEEIMIVSAQTEIREIILPDSSKVYLNRQSTLSYSNKFNESNRVVSLQGEAFFDVTKDPQKPFIVNALHSQTQVLGTSFNIRSIADTASDEILVVTGKVSFRNVHTEEKTYLLPGYTALANKEGKIETFQASNYNTLAWQSKILQFENSSLTEVVTTLQKYFDIDIVVQNPTLGDCRFTGTFSNPIEEEMLKVLSISMNLSLEKSDSSYIINGKGCQ